MRGKKEIIILLLVIVALGGYLYFKRADRMHYRLPQLEELDGKSITRIELSAGGQAVSLSRKGLAWTIEPAGHPADAGKVGKMLHDISTLTVTDLVSDTGSYSRYELGDKEKITVKAYRGKDLARQFDVGKTAPSGKHTFVMLPKTGNVYQAEDNFRADFQQNAASLRDRKVLGFVMDDIRKVTVTVGKASAVLSRQEAGAKQGKPGGSSFTWTDGSGRVVPKDDVDLIVSTLSSLECSDFLDDLEKGSLTTPEMTITLMGKQDHAFATYAKQGTVVPAVSSGSASVFTLPDYRMEELRKAAARLAKGGA